MKFVTSFIKIVSKHINRHPIILILILSVSLNLLLEMLSRRSLIDGMRYVFANPIMFFYNTLIVLFTLSISLLFKRKDFVIILFTTIWLGLGICNFILLGFRTTPLAAIDFAIIKSEIGLISLYLSIFQIIMVIFAIGILLLAIIVCWNKLPKRHVYYIKTIFTISIIIVLLFIIPTIPTSAEMFSGGFANLAEAYDDYGFAYCFSTSIVERGIKKPDNYSKEIIDQILHEIEPVNTYKPDITPNIIMVQLECFFDVNNLKNMSFSENPIPNFTRLKEEYSSGFLTVPTIGAGTANTEFEVITGMNLEHFGTGEYPYKTILRTSTCESIGYNLSEHNYKSHAIHNNSGSFYDRNIVFANMGFDIFTSIEYMNNVTYTPVGWAKDEILTTEIIKSLESTDTQDFIYAISVQAHGKYTNLDIDEDRQIKVLESINENKITSYEYYINQLYETDAFVGDLTSKLTNYNEPVVIVFFGDHLPSLSIENEDLIKGNRYQTEYAIWSNLTMEQVNLDLEAYQLSAYVMERLGFNSGILTKFHQKRSDDENYQEKLVMLQYDMLYGDMNVYDGWNPLIEKQLKMGVSEVLISKVTQIDDNIYINGEGFTPWSVVYIDEKANETIFIDSNTLIVKDELLKKGNSIFIAQIGNDKKMLSQTTEWIFR